jgi:MFS family permease
MPPLIPILFVGLSLPLWQLGLLVSVYLFVGGLGQAPIGVLSDRYDRWLLLTAGLTLIPLGYILFGLAPGVGSVLPGMSVLGQSFSGTFLVMSCAMFVSGLGHSVVHPVGYPLISSNVRNDKKGKILGIWGSASKFGDASPPLLVGALILVLPWEQIVLLLGGLGLVYAAFISRRFRRSFDTRPPRDNDGSDEQAITLRELLSADKRTFALPIALILAYFLCAMFTTNGLLTYTPLFVTDVLALSISVGGVRLPPESVANLYFSLLLISGGVSQLVMGAVSDRFDYRLVMVSLLGVSTVGLLLLAVTPLTPLVLIVLVVVIGAAMFGMNPARDALMSAITPPAYEGRLFGYVWTVALMASSAYPAAIGYIADTTDIRTSFSYFSIGTALAVIPILFLFSDRMYLKRSPNTTDRVDPSE